MVKQLFALAIGVVIAIAGLMIGTAVVTKTFDVANSTTKVCTDVTNASTCWTSTALATVNTDSGTALTTFSGFVPVVVIAAVGGLALLYLIFYLGRTSGGMEGM